MKFKFISILIIFLMVSSTMGCVSANTTTNHNNTNTSNEMIVVNDPTVSKIQNAINTAQTRDTILINGSSTDTGNITINKDALTIKGQNCTLNKVHWIVDTDTSFENITFENNTAFENNNGLHEGGVIHSNKGNVNVKNSTFINNNALDYGGAIYADSVTVSDCVFENNTAYNDYGGAIYAESVSIFNSTFINNHAYIGGGAVWSKKEVNVIKSVFTDNNCKGVFYQCKGGAIYSDADGVNIDNSSFINNYADDYGGAVWSDDHINVKNSIFENNTANDNDGGALYADDYQVMLSNSTFIGNRAGDNGGVFYDNGMGDHDFVRDCNIHDNSVGKRGGAIYMDSYWSQITLTGNAIYNNSAGYGEGLDVYTYGYFYIINGNWWGTNNPDWGKHLLYEHRTFLPNVDHSDSNPLKSNPFAHPTTIVASDMKITVNTTENLTATLKDNNGTVLANKNVTFTFNGTDYTRTTDANGEAKLTITPSKVGSYPVTITFAEDNDYKSTNITVTVKVVTPTTIVASDMEIPVNTSKNLTATLKDTDGKVLPDKNVTFTFNGTDYYRITDLNGEANLTITLSKVGSYPVLISFAGDNNYNSCSCVSNIKVIEKEETILTADNITTTSNNFIYNCTLKNRDNESLSDKKISLVLSNGENYNLTTNDSGVASVKLNLSSGNYTANATFAGDTDYNPSSCCSYLVINEDYEISLGEVVDASVFVKNYVETNKTLPDTVKVGDQELNIGEYSYLESKAVSYINLNKTNSTKLTIIKNLTKKDTAYTFKQNINLNDDVGIADKINNYIETNKITPNYTNYNSGKLDFRTYTYGFSKILNYYKNNNRLASTCTFDSTVF